MELPNIYSGDYRRLALVPIILVLIASYFILQIEPGLEFKGGVLITLELDREMSEGEIASKLVESGISDAGIRTYALGASHIAEIEIGHSKEMVELESAYTDFLETYDKYSKKQYEILVLKGSNGTTALQERDADQMKQHLVELRSKILTLSSTLLGRPATLSEDVDALKPEVESMFTEVTAAYRNTIISKISSTLTYKSYSFKLINPSLSEIFIGKIEWVLLIAALLSIITVFVIFRDIVPSAAVLIGATCDVVFALGAMGLFHIPLTLAAIASILMLVGFSLDTDILLTVRILKRGLNNPRGSAYEAMKTGITMSFSAILAFLALFLVGQITNVAIYQQISQIVLAGLVGDIIATWMLNAVIMIYHVEDMAHKSMGKVVI